MRTLATALAALIFTQAATTQAQYRIGPVYPERQPTYWSSGTNYDPFRLNWTTGRFDYVPIPYASNPTAPNYDPFQFNAYTGRWDYVPFAGVQPYGQQNPVVSNDAPQTIVIPPSAVQTEVPQPDFNTGQSTEVLLRPVEPEWMVRAAERSRAPTAAPATPNPNQHAPAPSIAPTTRPSAPTSPIVVAN